MFGLIIGRGRLLGDPKRLGKWGERRCERFLRGKGYKTLVRNYSCKTGEIDLTMVDGDGTIVFVEVKTRAEGQLSPPESAVTLDKQRKAARTARFFLAAYDIETRPHRFDVVGITLGSKGPARIEHFDNAFVD